MSQKNHKKLKYSLSFQHSSWLVVVTVNEAKGRLFKRKDDKYLIYVPVDLAEDSMFPFQTNSAVPVKISFTVGDNKLKIQKWKEEAERSTGKQ
ncbi:MAG: hypothetical protein E3J73_03175 [Candidatus Bathyarchaeum sp.]|nr:MAG: hypothetical protein E3J73_03175 [Candidatus Bathyarchaeum sp.]